MSFLSRLFGGSDDEAPPPVPEEQPREPLAAPAERTLAGFTGTARAAGASDVHLQAGAVPCARVEGELLPFAGGPLSVAEAEAMGAEALGDGDGGDTNAGTRDHDVSREWPAAGRVRLNVHRTLHGVGVAARLVPSRVESLESLGLPPELTGAAEHRNGLVLVTGPTGSGKSSTLAALVQHVNGTRADHVVTIEDPIEFVFESDRANVTQRELGAHTSSFSGALRAALREDPDVILVSELRDVDTIRTAVVAAETGHLVMGTLHTRGAVSTINRVLDLFPGSERAQVRTMLAATLRTVVSQRLLPRRGGGRRVVAYEVLHNTGAVANHIRDERTHLLPSLLQTGRKHGMIDLDTCLLRRVRDGLVEREVARRFALDPARFEDS